MTRVAALVAVVAAVTLLPGPRVAGAPAASEKVDPLYSGGSAVPEDLEAQRTIRRAAEYAEVKSWDRVAEILQGLIESPRSAATVFTEDGRVYVPLRGRCHEIVASLPEEGLRTYRTAVDPRARRRFEEALERPGTAGLREVVDQFLCSTIGDEALDRLADRLLDGGDLLGAHAAWERLLRTCPPDGTPDRAVVRLKLASVASLLGREEEAAQELQKARKDGGERSVAYGGREVELGRIRAVDLPSPTVEPRSTVPDRPPRLGRLRLVWKREFRDVYPPPAMAQTFRNYAGNGRFLALPTATALWVDGVLLAKDYNRLWAFDQGSLRRVLWRTDVPNPGRVAGGPSRRNANEVRIHFHAAYIDVGSQSIGAGDGVVVVTEGNVFAAHRRPPYTEDSPNRLAAYDVRTGRLLWTSSDHPLPFDGAYFVAAPSIRDGHAYVSLTTSDGSFRVAAFRLSDGKLAWQTAIGSTTLRGILRGTRSDASRPVMDDQSLYVLTNSGVVARLDRSDGRIRWIARTPRSHQDALNRANQGASHTFAASEPVLTDDSLVLAPSDGHHLVCFDRETGREKWKAETGPETTHLVGVIGERVVLGGTTLACYDLDARSVKGRLVWDRKIDDPAGRACILGTHIYVPTGKTIRRFSVTTPKQKGTLVLKASFRVGNLAPLPNGLLGSTERGVFVLADVQAQFSVITRRLRDEPDDLLLRLDRARLCRAEGGEREETAIQDLEHVLEHLGKDPGTGRRILRAEVRDLLMEILLRRARRGVRGSLARADRLAETLGERIHVALARADVSSGNKDPVAAARALQDVLEEASECVLGAGETTHDAEEEIRRRLLALAGIPAVQAYCDEAARKAGVEGADLVRRFPAASGAPSGLLAIARERFGESPAVAYDLALRVVRDYPDSAAARAAQGLARSALEKRGLDRDPPAAAPTVLGPAPEKVVGRVDGANVVVPRIVGPLPAALRGKLLVLVPVSGERRRLEARAVTDGSVRWAAIIPGEPQKLIAPLSQVDHTVAGGGRGAVVVGTPHGIYWVSTRGESEADRVRVSCRFADADVNRAANLLRNSRSVMIRKQIQFHALPNNTAWNSVGEPPRTIVARGVAVALLAGSESGYRPKIPDAGVERSRAIWSKTTAGQVVAEPVVHADRIVVTRRAPSRITVRRLDTGEVTTSVDLGADTPAGPARVGPDGGLFVATWSGEISRYDLLTGRWIWSRRLDQGITGLLHVGRRRLVLLQEDGTAVCLSATDAARLWSTRLLLPGSSVIDSIEMNGRLILRVLEGSGQQVPYRMAGAGTQLVLLSHKSRVRCIDLDSGDDAWEAVDIQPRTPHVAGKSRLVGDRLYMPATLIQRQIVVDVLRVTDGKMLKQITIPLKNQGRQPQFWLPLLETQAGRLLVRTPFGIHILGPGGPEEPGKTD